MQARERGFCPYDTVGTILFPSLQFAVSLPITEWKPRYSTFVHASRELNCGRCENLSSSQMGNPTPANTPPELSGEARLALLWMVIAFAMVFIPFLILAIRRLTISHRKSNRTRSHRTTTVSAWEEAGRRLEVDGGAQRLDDTVDLDPFDSPEDNNPW